MPEKKKKRKKKKTDQFRLKNSQGYFKTLKVQDKMLEVDPKLESTLICQGIYFISY
jgi:hypothetical protein